VTSGRRAIREISGLKRVDGKPTFAVHPSPGEMAIMLTFFDFPQIR